MLLRGQFSPTSVQSSRRILGYLLHSISAAATVKNGGFSGGGGVDSARLSPLNSFFDRARCSHARSARLDFRASYASQAAGFAVADYSEDEKTRAGDGSLDISKLNIHEDIVSSLSKKGITKLFPIQKAVLEPAMQGRDMIGRAKTGTGKTLAFGIPIMDKITRYNQQHGCGRNPLALILAPTRELARQVEKEFCESSRLDTLCVYGGTPIGRQMTLLSRGVDVVAGTPGRVIDLMKRGALDLSELQFVVLDEADQMLNVGFEEAVEVILEKAPKNRQTMMFSATMPNWIVKLTRKYLKDPLTIDLVGESDQKLAEGISLYSVVADYHSKAGVIGPLITEHANGGKSIVFTQTKRDADRLAYALGRKNYRCEALHGDISQSQRERTLHQFRNGNINILVATDVAARGLDIPNVDLVIHYELPSTSEIFVHRSGRTGRAGKKGRAILIYTVDQSRAVRVIERDVGCRFKELPPIAADGAEMEMSGGMYGGRFGSGSRFGDSGFSRPGGYGNSNSGRHGGSFDFGRSGGSGGFNSGRSGGFGEFGSGRLGSSGGSSRMGGGFESSGPSGSNNSGRSGFGRPSGGFGDGVKTDRSGGFGNFGSGRQSGFGDTRPSQNSGSFGDSYPRRFGSFGDTN